MEAMIPVYLIPLTEYNLYLWYLLAINSVVICISGVYILKSLNLESPVT